MGCLLPSLVPLLIVSQGNELSAHGYEQATDAVQQKGNTCPYDSSCGVFNRGHFGVSGVGSGYYSCGGGSLPKPAKCVKYASRSIQYA